MAEQVKVQGAADGFIKRIIDMVLLAGCHDLFGIHIEDSDLHYLTAVYPVPRHYKEELRSIFPGAKSQQQVAAAFRCLQKATGHNIAVLVPLLCFWQQVRAGKIDWSFSG